MKAVPDLGIELVEHQRMHSIAELRTAREAIPTGPGVYAWFFVTPMGYAGADNLYERDGMTFLYTGKAASLRKRLLTHSGNSSGSSTFRRSVGCLMLNELAIVPRQFGPKRKLAFETASEAKLTAWLSDNARVAWMPFEHAGDLEDWIIGHYRPPMNLQGNRGEHSGRLLELRAQARGL